MPGLSSTGVRVALLAVGSCRARAWLADGSRTFAWRTFPALVACIRHPREGVFLFDTGYGRTLVESTSFAARLYRRVLPFALPREQELAELLARLDVRPGDLAGVFVSHFHPDHIGGLRDLPGAPIVASRDGLARLRELRGFGRLREAFLPELLPEDFPARAGAIEDRPLVELGEAWRPFAQAHDLVGDGSLLAVALPGHALGQHGLICRLASGRTLFLVADAAWLRSSVAELALPAWPARRLLGDARALALTLQRLHALALRQPELLIVPSHCEESQRAFVAGGYGE